MKKIINQPKQAVSQLLDGIAFAHSDLLTRIPKTGVLLRKYQENKVALIAGGGTGHEPAHSGYLGKGMLAASVNGPIFVPPSPEEILLAIEKSDQGPGVLLIIKNFDVDVASFLKAEQLAIEKGHQVKHVIVNDDCSIDKSNFKKRRRGVAGTVFVHKILGAAAHKGYSLEELETLGMDVVRSMNTLGVALYPGSIPGKDQPLFTLTDDQISFGIGIHGESGYRTEPLYSSELLANELVNKLKVHYDLAPDKQFAILINGLGGTPLMELYIFANDVRQLMALSDLNIAYSKVGNYMTSTNMAGVSLTFLEIKDEAWLDFLEEPVQTYAWNN